jgi:hypothetical protein
VKLLKHPATIVATIALFVALSGAAGAAVTGLISGSQIKNGSIPVNKLSASAVSALRSVGGAANSNSNVKHTCVLNTTSTSTWCGTFTTVKFTKKTAVLVTGSLDLATSDGNDVQGEIGVCYAPHGSAALVSVQHVFPDFVAASASYFAQAVDGIVMHLKAGKYDVGLCVQDETANALNGRYTTSMLTVQTP